MIQRLQSFLCFVFHEHLGFHRPSEVTEADRRKREEYERRLLRLEVKLLDGQRDLAQRRRR